MPASIQRAAAWAAGRTSTLPCPGSRRAGLVGNQEFAPPLPESVAIDPLYAEAAQQRRGVRGIVERILARGRQSTQQARETQRGRHNARAASAAAHYRAAEAALTRLDLGDGRPGRT